MKKNSKRQIKDYSKYTYEDREYYGLFRKNKRVLIDVKRMGKILHLKDDILIEMNKDRKTVYFIPERQYYGDYMINHFRSIIDDLKDSWRNEIRPAMNQVRTPKQAGDDARTGYFMQTGILDYDECQMNGFFVSMQRESRYNHIMRSIISQFIHQFVSVIESITIKVLTRNGYKNDTFKRGEFNTFIQGYQKNYNVKAEDIIQLEDLDGFKNYDRMYKVWHFLKHNSTDLFKKIHRLYPEMLYEDCNYENGNLAMGVLKINTDFVNSLFDDSLAFFNELCEKVFKENLFYAEWNYDSYFESMVYNEIEGIANPLGLPPWV